MGENVPLLGDFLHEITESYELLKQHDENVDKIVQLQKKMLGISWHQESRKEISINLETVRDENKQIRKRISQRIKDGYNWQCSNDQDGNIMNEKLQSLWIRFQDSIQISQEREEEMKAQSKTKLVKAVQIMGGPGSKEEIEERIENGNLGDLTGAIVRETEDARRELGEVTERHNELKKLEESIAELCALFTEMRDLVEEQGKKIRKIENDVSDVQGKISQAVNAIRSAKKYWEKTNEKIRYLILVALLLTFIVTVILAVKFGSSNSDKISSETTTATTSTSRTSTPCPPQCSRYDEKHKLPDSCYCDCGNLCIAAATACIKDSCYV